MKIKEKNILVQRVKQIRKELMKAIFSNDFEDQRILENELKSISENLPS
jgi:hypothetical protein